MYSVDLSPESVSKNYYANIITTLSDRDSQAGTTNEATTTKIVDLTEKPLTENQFYNLMYEKNPIIGKIIYCQEQGKFLQGST